MMRILLALWFGPLFVFWGWFALARFDVFPSSVIFSRFLYDQVFYLYEQMTGLNEQMLIGLLVKICLFDTLIVLAIYTFRRREKIKDWWVSQKPVSFFGASE